MQLFDRVPKIDFMGPRKLAVALSIAVILVSIGSLAIRGLNLGLDFTGGVLIEVAYDGTADLEAIRTTLAGGGFDGAIVQNFGAANDVLIRLPPVTDDQESEGSNIGDRVLAVLQTQDASVQERRTEFVGPQIGGDLIQAGEMSMFFVLAMVFVYVMIRFRWKFAAGAIGALIHDVIITFGFFSVTGFEFDQTVLAAILAVIGYSLNDTIVVYDRIRENFRSMRRGSAEAIINASINQTMSRTIITGLTTLLVLFALFALGGESVRGFSMALIVGIIVGTYSSIYIASAAALFLDVSPADLMPPKREAVDDMP